MQAYNLLPYILNVKTESCTSYCSSRPYTAGPTASGSTNYCNCLPNYIWTISTQSCVSTFTDCASSNLEICPCPINLVWNNTLRLCTVSCSSIPNAVSLLPGRTDACSCIVNYVWYNSACIYNYNSCGNAIVGIGEVCDNGNNVGCSSGCVPDPGYTCSQILGSISFCYQSAIIISSCGNAIVEKE